MSGQIPHRSQHDPTNDPTGQIQCRATNLNTKFEKEVPNQIPTEPDQYSATYFNIWYSQEIPIGIFPTDSHPSHN